MLKYLVEKDYCYRETKNPHDVYVASRDGIINYVSPQEFLHLSLLVGKYKLERLHLTRKGGISQKNLYIYNGYVEREDELIISCGFRIWRFKVC
jgi:hypothetical protein